MDTPMYALTYCYEGVDDNSPFACTIAVSTDIEKLRAKMAECVAEDCTEPNEDDEWNTDTNYKVNSRYGDEIYLQHKKYINLYASYKIHYVEVIE